LLARAIEAELAAVPGLNAKLAATIVKARPFANLDALTRVRGIGAKMVDKLRSELTVD
jgi:DNA uptake protein ComE-like DNA-binding protein